ncbi:hypothetical protein CR513_09546, partial [Mucuna pruriens]
IVVHMTRKRSSSSLHPFDLEIDKALNRIRKSKNMHVGHSSRSFSFISKIENFEIKLDISDNPLYEQEPMENNNRTLKELAMTDVFVHPVSVARASPITNSSPDSYTCCPSFTVLPIKTIEGVLRGLFHYETARDPGRLHKDEGVSIFSRWSSKRLVVFATSNVHHIGRCEVDVPRKVLPDIQDDGHLEGDLWNLATHRGNIA